MLTERLADDVFHYVWQRSANGPPLEVSTAAWSAVPGGAAEVARLPNLNSPEVWHFRFTSWKRVLENPPAAGRTRPWAPLK